MENLNNHHDHNPAPVHLPLAEEKAARSARVAAITVPKTNIIDYVNQAQSPLGPDLPDKEKARLTLLANIKKTDLVAVCKQLGWQGKDEDYPKQKHIKVALAHTLISTAKALNWHLVRNAGYFYIFNGAYWLPLQDDEVKQLLRDATKNMGHADIECDALFIDNLFKETIQRGFFAECHYKKQSIINLRNGSLVLSEQGVTLKPFDHRDFLTHQLDFDYDPNATNSLFQSYLNDVLPDPDTQRTLQQVAGYLFIKGLKLEKIFFLAGGGANGKSVFFEILNGLIGKGNITNYSLESLCDAKGYHRAKIKDTIVNYGTDINLNNIDAGILKTLASQEPIEARLPYQEPFIMDDYAKLIFNTNKLDSFNLERTHGFERRLLIIPFDQTIPEDQQDKDLHTKILQDRAGVLNWIIEGARQVITTRTLSVSQKCADYKATFLKDTDPVAQYEEHAKENLHGSIYFMTLTDAYNDYKAFSLDAGYKHTLIRKNFRQRMEALGFACHRKDQGQMLEKNYLKTT